MQSGRGLPTIALPSLIGRKLSQRQILVVVAALITVTLLSTGGLDAVPVNICPRSAERRLRFDIEPYGVQGPLRWTDLSPSVQSDFSLGGTIAVQDGYFPANAADTRPKPWSRKEVDELIDVARKRGPVSAYGAQASDDLYAALDAHPVEGKRVLVVGTQVPW